MDGRNNGNETYFRCSGKQHSCTTSLVLIKLLWCQGFEWEGGGGLLLSNIVSWDVAAM
jgi:hypothetical protein